MKYTEEEIILQVDNLCVQYGEKKIIQHVNLIERNVVRPGKTQGQVIAVIGRSGRGKSTLFKALTGLVMPSTGSVLIPDYTKAIQDGIQPAKKVAEGDVGFVDQRYTLFRHKTVWDALHYALRNTAKTAQEKADLIHTYLSDWGLEKVKNQYPNELSGGQRQRVAIIEQLISSGFYIVLDEPFSGLDVGNIENVKKSFQLIEESNELNTIIFSTHDIELAAELADSIYIIGYPTVDNGSLDTIATIVQHYDLKKMGLAWSEQFTADHLDLVKELKLAMMKS